ncbi:sugar transporter ERD6-like 16 isoform X1 [Triticum aestivum]|uniref:sugar transporter ERD6-like 16 isoform X1 n=1 Tax=Triticum aestivum TaxID=4565 RepID=UPI001D030F8B|nr:sugar transporter ERD6-like 16 isoform X1 [Triticum aestivum]
MAAALPPSTAPPLLTRRSAAGLERSRRSPRGQHGGCCARRLPAAATAGATCGLTRRATAVAAAARAGEGAEEGSLQMVLLSTAVAVCGSFEFGTCVGYSAPAQAGIVGDIGLSNSQYGIFASVLTVGAMVGALTSGRLADTLGRKMTMRLAAIVGIFGWLAIYLAKGATMLCLGRVLLGYCTGVLSYVVPVFISEIAPKGLRGGLAASNQLFICSGCSAAYIIGATISWRSLVIVGLVPCVFLLVGLPFIPESPRWLANIGREKEFRASLQKLRGEKADISGEATEIIEHVESVLGLPKARIQDLFHRKNMYAVIVRTKQFHQPTSFPKDLIFHHHERSSSFDAQVGVGLKVFQQLGGINALGFYTSYIFSSAGFSGKLGTTLIGIIQIPITLLGALLMDRSGRRTLLLVSSSGTFVGCFLTGLSFYFKAQGLYTQLVPTLALYGILAYYVAYSIGMGPVPWVIMSEIFSINMKGIAGRLVTLVSWVGSFVISYSFSFLMDWNSAGTFFLFSAASLVTVLFVARLVPETKGRTLEEIQESLMAGT